MTRLTAIPRGSLTHTGMATPMTPDTPRTTGGIAGKIAGRVKAAAGTLTGNDALAREGRLQDAQADAELEAQHRDAEARRAEEAGEVEAERVRQEEERKRLQAEVEATDREKAAEQERRRAESEAAQREAQERAEAERARAAGEQAARSEEQAAVREGSQDEVTAALLRREAEAAEARADQIDPEETA